MQPSVSCFFGFFISFVFFFFFWCLLLLTSEKTLSKSQHRGGWQAMPFNNIL